MIVDDDDDPDDYE